MGCAKSPWEQEPEVNWIHSMQWAIGKVFSEAQDLNLDR